MKAPVETSPVPVIRMDNVSIGSMLGGSRALLKEIRWSVRANEFWVVAGHHGSGKTDLLLTLAGLMAPVTGEYQLMDTVMPVFEDARLNVRLRVGLVFNGGRLMNHLNVSENVALPVRYHMDLDEASALDKVAPILAATGLTQFASQLPGTLGRHWHHRAGLARALATDPDLLLLDDPLSGVDSRQASWWVGFLNDLRCGNAGFRSRGMTIVLTTDTLVPWRTAATHCALLEDGTIIPMGCLSAPEVHGNARVQEYISRGHWSV